MNKLVYLIAFAFVFIFPLTANAACTEEDKRLGTTCLDNPLANGSTDVREIIGVIIKGVLGVLGSITLVMMVWGGFQWLTSAGNMDKVESGKKTMVWSAIGVAVALSSYILVKTLTDYLSTGKS